MYELFLETKAAQQIDDWVAQNPDRGYDAEDIKQRAYAHLLEQKSNGSDYLVTRCINNDSHRSLDIDAAFIWRDTKEGHGLWERINNKEGW
jgi:hypothetical protein